MVKKLIFIILSLFCTPAFGQSKCWCDSVYAHFEELMSNQLIMLWETPPDFKEHTDVYKIRMLLTRYNCAVKLVVDTLDTPKCIKFLPEIDPFVAESIINEIKECNFSAASVRNKIVVAPAIKRETNKVSAILNFLGFVSTISGSSKRISNDLIF